MPGALPAGPYRVIQLDDGSRMPYYIVPFDKRGRCEGPETRRHLVDAIARGAYTDFFLFSHGWNNDWSAATQRYDHFITGFMAMRRQHRLAVPPPYRPVLAGIFWPSTALVFGEVEQGPAIAAGEPGATDRAVAEERQAIHEIAEHVQEDGIDRFYELTQKRALTEAEARELAGLVRPLFSSDDREVRDESVPAVDEIVALWSADAPDADDLSTVGLIGGEESANPQAAGFGSLIKSLDPRHIIRGLTVRLMKDRAGTVGAQGVGPLLRNVLDAERSAGLNTAVRVHMIGHSYGAKVVLSSLAAGPLPRRVHSVLLLQPAVSHLCFAGEVPGTGRPGGYRHVLDRVEKPIFATFSDGDVPLRRLFHLALRRSDDLGEARIAAAGDPPSVYAALGGFGPRQSGEKLIDIEEVNSPYVLDDTTRVYGIRASRTISGHGDISNESTWWALHTLTAT